MQDGDLQVEDGDAHISTNLIRAVPLPWDRQKSVDVHLHLNVYKDYISYLLMP